MALETVGKLRLPWWTLPLAALAAALVWESNVWNGSPVARAMLAGPPTTVLTGLLPDYEISGGIGAHAETVQRTIFNPTRRPAPAVALEPAERQAFKKGQFAFVGSSMTGDQRIAFLREITGGRSRMVRQGDQLDGITIADVSPDTVRLQLGTQSEELHLTRPGTTRNAPVPGGSLIAVPASPGAIPAAAYLRGAPVASPAPVDAAATLPEGEPPPNQD